MKSIEPFDCFTLWKLCAEAYKDFHELIAARGSSHVVVDVVVDVVDDDYDDDYDDYYYNDELLLYSSTRIKFFLWSCLISNSHS